MQIIAGAAFPMATTTTVRESTQLLQGAKEMKRVIHLLMASPHHPRLMGEGACLETRLEQVER